MANLYFGKMNDLEQVKNRKYKTTDKGFLGDIQIGDYAFIKLEGETKPASVKRLWKLSKILSEEEITTAVFDEICNFDIPLLKFESLDLFVLNMNLLNKCNKQTRGLSFYKVSLVDEAHFNSLVESPSTIVDYLNDSAHYRKIIKLDSKEMIKPNLIDVQLYKEGDSWLLAKADFLGDDLWENFDSSQFELYDKYEKKGKNTAKDKMFQFLSGMDVDVSMMGLWDLFCGSVKENTETKKEKKTSSKRNEFIDYCKENGVGRAASQYESGIRSMESELSVNVDDEFARDECVSLQRKIEEHTKGTEESQIRKGRNWKSYVKKYVDYKGFLQSLIPSLSDETQNSSNICTTYDYSQAKHSGVNKVFYGTPGCGKSYYLENEVLVQEEIDDNSAFRTTFYQDYSNSDFVGQVLPLVHEDKTVTYEFLTIPFPHQSPYITIPTP